jgi:uncharacterized protein
MRLFLIAAALLALPLAANAASFDCTKAATPAEKAICGDTGLSKLDSDLNSAFISAMSAAANPDSLRSSQRDWLKRRNACGGDAACLQRVYQERLDRLQNTGSTGRTGDARWVQVWQLDNDNPSASSQISITGKPPALKFSIEANNGGNSGALEGKTVLKNDRATYRDKDGCQLDFVRVGQRLTVRQNQNDCGAGNGVYYGGNYLPASAIAAKPKASLVSLKVLDANQDAAARKLLGEDYQNLLDTINMQGEIEDKDGLGAKVGDYFVRGLANTNAAVVMRKGNQLWIGLLVFDKQNNSRMRYYTNVPAWKKRLPKTIQTWHDERDPKLPVDYMP